MYKKFLKRLGINTDVTVKIYKGYGHQQNLHLSGHVLRVSSKPTTNYHKSILRNIFQLFKLFFVKAIAGVPVVLKWNDQEIHAVTETDGYFKLEWASETSVPAGFHDVRVDYTSAEGEIIASGKGAFFVPHITQLGIISDIDDTFLVSYSSTIFKRLWTLFSNNARSRRAFEGVREHYRLLEQAQTDDETPNPLFYVSSSEWNLYDYLNEFLRIQKLPQGIFLLSQLKRWYQLVKTGKTKHEGKFARVVRIMDAFPNQRFILLGDNSQKDPEIYRSIAEHRSGRVFAVYIRNVSNNNKVSVAALESSLLSAGIPFCFFRHSKEAIEHSIGIGLGQRQDSGAKPSQDTNIPGETNTSGETNSSGETNNSGETNSSGETNNSGETNTSGETNNSGDTNISGDTNTSPQDSDTLQNDTHMLPPKTNSLPEDTNTESISNFSVKKH